MPSHYFDTDVATEFGVTEAILINHFQFWIAHNRANRSNHRQGRTWTFNSIKALQELFPYMGVKQIRGALRRLEESGILVVDNHNQTAYDRTLWYAFADEDRWLGLGNSRFAKRANQGRPEGTPIPDKSPDKSPDEERSSPPPPPEPQTAKSLAGDPPRASEHAGVRWPWDTETFWEAWAGWREYKLKQHKFRYALLGSEQAALNLLERLSGGTEATAHAVIMQSLANGWKGFFELKKNDTYAPHQQPPAGGGPAGKPSSSAARVEALRNWGHTGAGHGAGG